MVDEVRCTTAEFGPGVWDGPPFDAVPDWLRSAVNAGRIWLAPQGADYASYWVLTRAGVAFATAGDTIAIDPDGWLSVRETGHWEPKARLRWDPALWGPMPAAA